MVLQIMICVFLNCLTMATFDDYTKALHSHPIGFAPMINQQEVGDKC